MKVRIPSDVSAGKPDTAADVLPLSERKRVHIANPAAAGGRHLAAAEKAVAETGGTLLKSERPGHFALLIGEALAADPYAHLVIYGGDGTVFEAVNGIMNSGKNGTAVLSVIPAGSGNDFSTLVNGSGVLEKYVPTRIDLVRTSSGGEIRYYANMMNIGFDCAVVKQTNVLRKFPLFRGSFAYIAGAAKELIRKKTTDAVITLEGCTDPAKEEGTETGTKVFRQKILLTAAGNGAYCGGGFNALPLASVTDGYLDVLVVNDVSRLKFIRLVGDYRAGTYIEETGELKDRFRGVLEFVRCRRMTVEGPDCFCLDGEVFGTGTDRKVEAEIVPGAILYAAV